jgi:uncharacterized protein YndB with AHSA1/START domain
MSSPLSVSVKTRINAPSEKVWQVLTDFGSYGSWHPILTLESQAGPLAVGTLLRGQSSGAPSGEQPVAFTIARVQEPNHLAWTGGDPEVVAGRHSLGMSVATDADSGVLSGVFNTTQQVGGALGLTVLTTLAASRTGNAQTSQALTSGYHLAWTVGAILAGASVAVAAIALRQPGGPDRHQIRLLDFDGPIGHRLARDAPRLGGTRGIPDSVESES